MVPDDIIVRHTLNKNNYQIISTYHESIYISFDRFREVLTGIPALLHRK